MPGACDEDPGEARAQRSNPRFRPRVLWASAGVGVYRLTWDDVGAQASRYVDTKAPARATRRY
jgi:hypothetical protein